MSLAMHTIRRQVVNLNIRIGDGPENYYSENENVNLRPQTNTGFQSFQNKGRPFGGPRRRGNYMQDRPRYNQGQINQQLNQRNGPPPSHQQEDQDSKQEMVAGAPCGKWYDDFV